MSVFATKFFEPSTDDVNGGNDWSWNPSIVNGGNKGTGPGRPTQTLTHTHVGGKDDQNTDHDTPAESSNSAGGAMVA